MNDLLAEQAVEITKYMVHLYYGGQDMKEVLSYLTEDTAWIGSFKKEMKFSAQEIVAFFQQGKRQLEDCDILAEDLRVLDCGETCCMVSGSVTVKGLEENKVAAVVNQRLSFLFRLIDGELKVAHMHISNSSQEVIEEEFHQKTDETQSYENLQKVLKEKTEVINMISDNIGGGLKGSNDDDTYSYFYVNEGLPKMLGYTREEFMEKSGGCAVGAVYPDDLEAALKDCGDCFAKGPVYSTEYRMEKKDGSLIWVLDSGRKALNSEGAIKINSIIMDITPLKKAQFELEIERERYRIALENIKDVMYEYDIEHDTYVTFKQDETEGKKELERNEIPNFSKVVELGGFVHPKDAGTLLDILSGKTRDTVEIRLKSNDSIEEWRWNRIRCSVIYDSVQKPVKTIGMMKDITDKIEKEIVLMEQASQDGLTHLLNQTSLKAAVQRELNTIHADKPCRGAILLLDLDNFKLVNDTMGHLFGNDVLIEVAKVLKQNGGEKDIIGRVGGDEFLLFLRDASRESAVQCADRIIWDVSQICRNDKIGVSCSIGIAMCCGLSSEFDYLFQMADELLYRAKRRGRKCWEISDNIL